MIFSVNPSITERVLAQRASAASAPSVSGGSAPAAPAAEPFHQALHGLGKVIDGGERLVDRALRGGEGQMSPAQLIALQAGIYRYSEAVDLTVKLIDHAATAVRTTLQNPG
jgi:hypothetical protein